MDEIELLWQKRPGAGLFAAFRFFFVVCLFFCFWETLRGLAGFGLFWGDFGHYSGCLGNI